MLSREDLDAAVADGLIPPETARALLAHAQLRRHQASLADEEHFQLVAGFNDVFVVIASVLMLAALGTLGGMVAPSLGAALVAAAAWGLAEFFVRRRRMALPAIVLLLAFVGAAFFLGARWVDKDAGGALLGSALGVLAAWAHWRRFRVPITVAAGWGAALAAAISLLLMLWPAAKEGMFVWLLLGGLVCFAQAMRWDMRDVQRTTGRADVAFWLHLLAAPLLVHPVFALLSLTDGHHASLGASVVVLGLYAVLAGVSLAIDRRALMVSALGYVLYTFTRLVDETTAFSASLAITSLLIGGALLLLSALWHRCRQAVLQRLPASLRQHLPPLRMG